MLHSKGRVTLKQGNYIHVVHDKKRKFLRIIKKLNLFERKPSYEYKLIKLT